MAKQNPIPLIKAQQKVDEVINKQIDKIIDKTVDKTLEEIDKLEKQSQDPTQSRQGQNTFEKQKLWFGLSYFLFFIAFFCKGEQKHFYANQGFVLFLFLAFGSLVFRVGLAFVHLETALIVCFVFYVFVFLMALFGFIKTLKNEQNVRLPLIGKINLINHTK